MNDLIIQLEELYLSSRQAFETAVTDMERNRLEAYANGVKDALKITKRLLSNPVPEAETLIPEKLHQMSLEAVSKLIMQSSADPGGGLETYTAEELAEAAFRFENEMMACLGDDNTIPFDAYTGMAPGQLVAVIKTSVAKIEELT